MAAGVGVAVAEHVARGVEGASPPSPTARAPRRRVRSAATGVVYYAPRETVDGRPLRAFVALGTVVDDAPGERDLGAFRPWVRRVDWQAVTPAPVRPLLDRPSFVTDRRGWGMAFRRGLFPVSDADSAVIEGALRDG